MDYTKNYINWIDGLTKDQFDVFIKSFIKDYWKVDDVIVTDGKGDGGIDIKIYEGKKNKKIPLQITIDRNVYSKLLRDLDKINKLIEDFEYSDVFYFYYSHGAAEGKVIEIVEKARVDFSIDLKIFDNKVIASFLDKAGFEKSRSILRENFGEFLKTEESYFDPNQKLYFDYLSYADDSKELKEQFIVSFILYELFKSNQNTTLELLEKIKSEFEIQISIGYLDRLVNNLISTKKIEKINNGYLKLSDDEKNKIKNVKENSELLEREFSTKLQDLISENDSNLEIRIIIEKLNVIFQSQNNLDLNEISNGIEVEDTNLEIKSFYEYVRSCFPGNDNYKEFLKKVFQLCEENNFLVKLSAGKMFKQLINNPEFSTYSRRINKEIFLDTPILIYLLLVMKETDLDYENIKFKISKELFDLIQSGDKSANYNTTQLYITELSDHVRKAIKLIPIEELGLFDSLGGSDNEILNLYLDVKQKKIFEGTFREYIESFGFSITKAENDNRNEYINQFLYLLFKDNGILIDDIPPYNKDFKNKKDFDNIERTLAGIYSRANINRHPRSLLFDSLLLTHIYNLDDQLIDPTIITWDKTFYEFRKEFHPNNPNFRYWHLFTPGKFIDHMSLLKFKINGNAISKEILSMIEAEYEVVKGVRKIADILTSIVDLKSATGINLTKGLADIRASYIYQLQSEQVDKDEKDENLPTDDVISNLVDYYNSPKSEFNFSEFIESLKDEIVIDNLLKIVRFETDNFIKYNKLSSSYITKFNEVIKTNKTK